MEFETLAIHYVLVDDKVQGPYSLRDLNELRKEDKIPETAFYSVKGIEGWHPIKELFKPAIVKPPPPLDAQKRHNDAEKTKSRLPARTDAILGMFLIFAGELIALYFFAFFDPHSIQLAPGPIDVSLLFHQQNGMLLGISTMLLGGILYRSSRS